MAIQKLKKKQTKFGYVSEESPLDMLDKINELCDVVNEQQKQIDKMSCAILDLATPNGENKALESIKLERTRKALDVVVDALKTVRRYTAINQFAPKSREAHIVAKKAVAEITALTKGDDNE